MCWKGSIPKGYEFKVDTNQRYYPKPKPMADPTVEVYGDDKFSVTQEKKLEKAFNDAYLATNGIGMRREEVVNLVLRLGNEGYLPLKWSNKSVLELNEHVRGELLNQQQLLQFFHI